MQNRNEHYNHNIIIIEDDDFVRHGFSLLINSIERYRLVNSYKNCEDAIKNIYKDRPDLIFIDIELPGMSGIDGIKTLKKIDRYADIIVLTRHEDTETIFSSFQAGAIGYISKSKPNFYSELLKAIEDLDVGGAPISSQIAKKVIESFQKSLSSPISQRESGILKMLALGKTYTEIADELDISKDTVRTHMRNIYQKLEVTSKSQAIARAMTEKFI